MSISTKKVLITFISYDQDSYSFKKDDSSFMCSHLPALESKGIVTKEELDKVCLGKLKIKEEEIRDRLAMQKENISSYLSKDDIWRPTVALAMGYDKLEIKGRGYEPLHFDTIYILHDKGNQKSNHDAVIDEVLADVRAIVENQDPKTEIIEERNEIANPFIHADVYIYLHNLFKSEEFHQPNTEYYVNIGNGTSAMKNCLFLLTQERVIDAKRIAPTPWNNPVERYYRCANGSYQIEDPSDFDAIYRDIRQKGLSDDDREIVTMNTNIETKNPNFKETLRQIARVVKVTHNPILLTGPSGAGKTQIAKNIFSMLKNSGRIPDNATFQHINCATLAGDPNMTKSALFGEKKGAHSTASEDRVGALKLADKGILFLDEIGTLGQEEQAMLLTAIEDKRFRPLGATEDETSDFMLICGTNVDLWKAVKAYESEDGRARNPFRRDLFERINLWHFTLPSLHDRIDEIEHQCQIFIDEVYPGKPGRHKILFPEYAKKEFNKFIKVDYEWPGNFRELNAILERMCEMAEVTSNKITPDIVNAEIERTKELRQKAGYRLEGTRWIRRPQTEASPTAESPVATPVEAPSTARTRLAELIGDGAYNQLSPMDRVQLDYIADHCEEFSTLKELGKAIYGYDKVPAGQEVPKDFGASGLSRKLTGLGLTFRKGLISKRPDSSKAAAEQHP